MVINADPEENLIAELKIKAALKRGAKIVTVSSSEIPLVKFSELWMDSKRGTTTALINGICDAVIEKGREDEAFIRERTTGFEAFKASVGQFDAGLVSEITGVKRRSLKPSSISYRIAKPMSWLSTAWIPTGKNRRTTCAMGNLCSSAAAWENRERHLAPPGFLQFPGPARHGGRPQVPAGTRAGRG